MKPLTKEEVAQGLKEFVDLVLADSPPEEMFIIGDHRVSQTPGGLYELNFKIHTVHFAEA